MSYLFFKVFLKIKHHFVLYSLLVLELCIGTTILFFSANYFICYQKGLNKAVNIDKNFESRLSIAVNDGSFGSGNPALDKNDLDYLSECLSNNFSVFIGTLENDLPFFDNNKTYGIRKIYTDQVSTISCSKEDLKEMKSSLSKEYLASNDVNLSDVTISTNKKLQAFLNIQKINVDKDDLKINTYVLFYPLSELTSFDTLYPGQINIYINKNMEDKKLPEKKVEILSFLNKKHENYSYHFDNDLKIYMASIEGEKYYMIFYGSLSLLLLLVFFISFSGLFNIIVNKRIPELAVSESVGAKKSYLIIELILENYSLCFVGIGAGCIFGSIISAKVSNDVFLTFINWETFLLLLLFSFLISAFSSFQGIKKIKNLTIHHLLRKST